MFSSCRGNPWLLLLSKTHVPEKFADAALTTQTPVRNMRVTAQPIRTFFITTSLKLSDKLQFVVDVRVRALPIATNKCATNITLVPVRASHSSGVRSPIKGTFRYRVVARDIEERLCGFAAADIRQPVDVFAHARV